MELLTNENCTVPNSRLINHCTSRTQKTPMKSSKPATSAGKQEKSVLEVERLGVLAEPSPSKATLFMIAFLHFAKSILQTCSRKMRFLEGGSKEEGNLETLPHLKGSDNATRSREKLTTDLITY